MHGSHCRRCGPIRSDCRPGGFDSYCQCHCSPSSRTHSKAFRSSVLVTWFVNDPPRWKASPTARPAFSPRGSRGSSEHAGAVTLPRASSTRRSASSRRRSRAGRAAGRSQADGLRPSAGRQRKTSRQLAADPRPGPAWPRLWPRQPALLATRPRGLLRAASRLVSARRQAWDLIISFASPQHHRAATRRHARRAVAAVTAPRHRGGGLQQGLRRGLRHARHGVVGLHRPAAKSVHPAPHIAAHRGPLPPPLGRCTAHPAAVQQQCSRGALLPPMIAGW